jgi:hypothetical protein
MDKIEIYKKYFKMSSASGFITVSNWTIADRVQIEIGANDPKTNASLSVSTVYVPTVKMLAYLHAEVHDNIAKLYPSMLTDDKHQHGITYFGGKGPARVFKVEDWTFDAVNGGFKGTPGNVRRFKAGEFELKAGTTSSEPEYSKPISRNFIQMKPEEIAELYHQLHLTQQAHETAWLVSGMTRSGYHAKLETEGKLRRAEGNYD